MGGKLQQEGEMLDQEEGLGLGSHAAPLPFGLGSDHTGEGLGLGNLLWLKLLYRNK